MSDAIKVYSQGKFDPKHPLITQSFLGMFAACPLAAKFRYIDGIISPPGIAALQGTATDAAVTYGCDSVIKTGKDAPLKDKVDLALTTFHEKKSEHRIFEDDDLNALSDQTEQLVTAHHKTVAATLKPVRTQEAILIEGPEFNTAGTIDIVEEGDLLADTKTSGKSNEYPGKGIIQSALYTKLYQDKHGVTPKGFRFDVVVKTKVPKIERVEVAPSQIASGVLDHVIHATMNELKSSLASDVWRIAENGHWRCASTGKWCAYLSMCPKGKK